MSTTRIWLNKDPEASGFVIAKAGEVQAAHRNGGGMFSASIEIGDCNRRICLDFDAYQPSHEDIAELKAKANRLYRVIRKFRDEVVAACEELEGMVAE